jgi:uncharacterized membrane protein YoaK (UPF0700 family)
MGIEQQAWVTAGIAFPAAVFVCKIVLAVLGTIKNGWDKDPIVGLVVCALLVTAVTLNAFEQSPSIKAVVVAAILWALNSFVLYASVAGISVARRQLKI